MGLGRVIENHSKYGFTPWALGRFFQKRHCANSTDSEELEMRRRRSLWIPKLENTWWVRT